MAINYQKAKNYLDEVRGVEQILSENQELFNEEKLIEFKQVTNALVQDIERSKQDLRKLSIGIVGAVKAGKSSFLNACLFDGEDYLPKAATPMTAALTKITYSDDPKAVIHFYSREDWNIIEKHADTYDKNMKKAYEDYLQTVQRRGKRGIEEKTHPEGVMSPGEYEKSYQIEADKERENAIFQGAKELTRMAQKSILNEKLGTKDEISGDVISQLDEYVGANGKYTPLVSYVELQVNNPALKDLEIVDTPGLNDPIVSRSVVTKQFLRSCDVVLLLSPCSQFMDDKTVGLMANTLPTAGVREILVVGSKLDSGILNENHGSFAQMYKKSLQDYKDQFRKNLMQAKSIGNNLDILDKMDPEKVLFSSSVCFTIDKKINNNISLNEDERKVYDNLHSRFRDFEDKFLSPLSGISKIWDALEEVLNRKIEIIEDKNHELLERARSNHLQSLDRIIQESVSSRSKLESVSIEELRQRVSNITNVIDLSREKLWHVFEGAILQSDEKVQWLIPQLSKSQGKYQNFEVEKSVEDHYRIEKVGLLGLKKERIDYQVKTTTANVRDIMKNIKNYASYCHQYVLDEFKHVFNKEEFAHKIKEVVLSAFEKSQKEFDEEEILLPLQNVLTKISIPHIGFEYSKYADELKSRFPQDYVENTEIHELKAFQGMLLDRIESDLKNQLLDALTEIKETLQNQAKSFADQIERDFCSESEKLKGQVAERERYLLEYQQFAEKIKELRRKVLNFNLISDEK